MNSPWLSMFGAYPSSPSDGIRPVMFADTMLPVLFKFAEGRIKIDGVIVKVSDPVVTVTLVVAVTV